MARPELSPWQDVRVWNVQDRRGGDRGSRPWVVRWAVDGRQRSRAFQTKSEAEGFRSELLLAKRLQEPFDPDTREPVRWAPSPPSIQMHHWVRRWLAEQWDEWQPRTRVSAVEALTRFVPLMTRERVDAPPDGLRAYLAQSLRPDWPVDESNEHERWLDDSMRGLTTLQRDVLAEVDTALGRGLRGGMLAPATAQRYRKIARACVRRAVELDLLDRDPGLRRRRGGPVERQRVSRRPWTSGCFPSRALSGALWPAIPTHQPGSGMYYVMTAVAYFGGLRPSEVIMLSTSRPTLPASGWGAIAVTEADISHDEPGEPKTGRRTVPIPPELVAILQRLARRARVRDRRTSCSAPATGSALRPRTGRGAGTAHCEQSGTNRFGSTTAVTQPRPPG